MAGCLGFGPGSPGRFQPASVIPPGNHSKTYSMVAPFLGFGKMSVDAYLGERIGSYACSFVPEPGQPPCGEGRGLRFSHLETQQE